MGCLESLITVRFCVGNADSVLYLIIIMEVIFNFASFVVLSLSVYSELWDSSEETSELMKR